MQGFSKIFCCQQELSENFSLTFASAGVQQNILLSARIQQKIQQKDDPSESLFHRLMHHGKQRSELH